MNNNRLYRQGFTLAELLAVVIIVALMVALSVGYYKKSVEQSRFSEGLTAAANIAESINRAYFDDKIAGVSDSSAKKPRKIDLLDVGMTNLKACSSVSDYCKRTKYFEIQTNTVTNGSVIKAYRGTSTDYKYAIEVTTSYGSPKDRVACVGTSSGSFDAASFCESMGYTSKSGNYYTKP